MKIQNLAVIFIVIILPISLVISTYTKYQIQTVNVQSSYDSKLLNATYDAIKAYQMNSAASGSSDIANSKLRDIEASANTFFNSVSSNFNMSGYNKDVLKEYVPALVYTMYDGMYLYSTYENRLNSTGKTGKNTTDVEAEGAKTNGEVVISSSLTNPTYDNTQDMYGLRPYVFYSCRYVADHNGDGKSIDVTITYSLDNYISIQGTDPDGKPINIQGYVLSKVGNYDETNKKISYRGVDIEVEENIYQNFYNNGTETMADGTKHSSVLEEGVHCRKIDGVKYYNRDNLESYNNFSFLNNSFLEQNNGLDVINNDNAIKYYTEALKLQNLIRGIRIDIDGSTPLDSTEPDLSDLYDLRASDAKDENGVTPKIFENDDTRIFDTIGDSIDPNKTSIEEPNSNFNQHRLKVIRNTIEYNLSTAIANYNNLLGSYDFRMPKLKEEDWDKILNNIAVISFLQGVNIGGKVYNGYAVVPNNENEDVVADTSIYIIGSDNCSHEITCNDLKNDSLGGGKEQTARGIFKADLEPHSITEDGTNDEYYIPKGNSTQYLSTDDNHTRQPWEIGTTEYSDYKCIVTPTDLNTTSENSVYTNIYKYVDTELGSNPILKKIYYTALARERYGTYKGARFTVDFGESEKIEIVASNNNSKKVKIDTYQFGWPINSTFPYTTYGDDYNFGMRDGRLHDGLDLHAPSTDQRIFASADGTVHKIERNNSIGDGSYGNRVVIDHGNGIFTFYAHLYSIDGSIVEGASVSKGQIIGIEGKTGGIGQQHLHFGCYIEDPNYSVNPESLFSKMLDFEISGGNSGTIKLKDGNTASQVLASGN